MDCTTAVPAFFSSLLPIPPFTCHSFLFPFFYPTNLSSSLPLHKSSPELPSSPLGTKIDTNLGSSFLACDISSLIRTDTQTPTWTRIFELLGGRCVYSGCNWICIKDQWRNFARVSELRRASGGKSTNKARPTFLLMQQTKFEKSSVNRLAGNPRVNKAKSPPRCGFVRMQFSFESIWGLTLIGQCCLMPGSGVGKSVWNAALMELSAWSRRLLLIGASRERADGIDHALSAAHLAPQRRPGASTYSLCKMIYRPINHKDETS